MFIYKDGVEHEKIDLTKFTSKSKMRNLMEENGFVTKREDQAEQAAVVAIGDTGASTGNGKGNIYRKEKRLRRKGEQKSLVTPHMPKMYLLLPGGVLCVVFLVIRRSRRRLQRHTV